MKIALVVPYRKGSRNLISHPIGLGYLSTALKNKHNVKIINANIDNFYGDSIVKSVIDFDVIGFNAFTRDIEEIRNTASLIKSHFPKKTIILGGPYPSSSPDTCLIKIPTADYGFIGEAEESLAIFLDFLAAGSISDHNKTSIPGLIWREMGEIKFTNPSHPVKLDSLGFPDWDAIDISKYPKSHPSYFVKRTPYLPIITTRGCPYSCTYCAAWRITGRKYRRRSSENVLAEIDFLYKNKNIREIAIYDDNFTLDTNFAKEVCAGIIERKYDLSMSCPNGLRLETLDEELIKLMKEAGWYNIPLGVESGSERILKHMGKTFSLQSVRDLVNLNTKHGIMSEGFFILGYPEETVDDIRKTIDFAVTTDFSAVHFALFQPLPGTKIYDIMMERNEITDNYKYGTWADCCYSPKGISLRQMKNFQRIALLRFYLRPKILLRTIKTINSLPHMFMLLKRGLEFLA